jgi:hypothetical protein
MFRSCLVGRDSLQNRTPQKSLSAWSVFLLINFSRKLDHNFDLINRRFTEIPSFYARVFFCENWSSVIISVAWL